MVTVFSSTRQSAARGSVARVLAVPLLLAVVATAGAPGVITIRRGDTLSELALRYRTTVATLRALNDIPGNNLIVVGDSLRLPARADAPQVRVVDTAYTVVRGDSLIGIAMRYGVDPVEISARNDLPRSRVVQLGQRLFIPVRQVVAPPAVAPAVVAGTARQRSAAAHRAALAARPAPSRAHVRDLIVRTARSAHVDPALALAVAHQESGFQQRVVSNADAIGVMQVLPATGEWLSGSVLHRPLDLLAVEDNVLAGVTLLRQLLRVASTDDAVAAYYQGLGALRSRGVLPETQAYVRNVAALRAQFA